MSNVTINGQAIGNATVRPLQPGVSLKEVATACVESHADCVVFRQDQTDYVAYGRGLKLPRDPQQLLRETKHDGQTAEFRGQTRGYQSNAQRVGENLVGGVLMTAVGAAVAQMGRETAQDLAKRLILKNALPSVRQFAREGMVGVAVAGGLLAAGGAVMLGSQLLHARSDLKKPEPSTAPIDVLTR